MARKRPPPTPSLPRKDRLTVRVTVALELTGIDDETAPQADIQDELARALRDGGKNLTLRREASRFVQEAVWRAIRAYTRDNDTADTLTAGAAVKGYDVRCAATYDRCPKAPSGYHARDNQGLCHHCGAEISP